MRILVSRAGQQLGPFSLDDLRRELAAGRVSASDLAWWEGQAAWVPVGQVPGLSQPAAAPPFPGASPPAAFPGGATVDNGSGLAVGSLVLGLVSLIGGACVTGLPAIICGHMALSRQKRAGASDSKGLAIAGLILGYGITLLSFVMAIGFAVFFTQVAGKTSRHMRNNPNLEVFVESAELNSSLTNANLIFVACSKYAARHNGEFPPALSDLEADDLMLSDALTDPLAPQFGNEGFFYFRPSRDADDSMVIIASRGKTDSGQRAVTRKNGSTTPEKWNPPADL